MKEYYKIGQNPSFLIPKGFGGVIRVEVNGQWTEVPFGKFVEMMNEIVDLMNGGKKNDQH